MKGRVLVSNAVLGKQTGTEMENINAVLSRELYPFVSAYRGISGSAYYLGFEPAAFVIRSTKGNMVAAHETRRALCGNSETSQLQMRAE